MREGLVVSVICTRFDKRGSAWCELQHVNHAKFEGSSGKGRPAPTVTAPPAFEHAYQQLKLSYNQASGCLEALAKGLASKTSRVATYSSWF